MLLEKLEPVAERNFYANILAIAFNFSLSVRKEGSSQSALVGRQYFILFGVTL
jgi:hypothetical protein